MLNSPLELLPSTFYVPDPFPKVKHSLQLQGIHDLVGTDEQIGTHGAPSSWVHWEPEVMPLWPSRDRELFKERFSGEDA